MLLKLSDIVALLQKSCDEIHLAIDERTLAACAVEVTGSNVCDAP